MPGNDQERFEDYQELEHFIEELQQAHVPPAIHASMARQARIYSMVMLLCAASPEGTELRPEFMAALWARLEHELQPSAAGLHRSFRSDKRQPEKGRGISRRLLLTGGALAAASVVVGIGVERVVERAGNDRVPPTTEASVTKGQAGNTPLPEGASLFQQPARTWVVSSNGMARTVHSGARVTLASLLQMELLTGIHWSALSHHCPDLRPE